MPALLSHFEQAFKARAAGAHGIADPDDPFYAGRPDAGGLVRLELDGGPGLCPASGIAQVLYFRSALLPALERGLGQRDWALGISALMFSLFHAGMFTVAPVGAALAGLGVTFAVGIGWGWQVQQDRTVVWAMLHHSILQMILRLFVWV
jgi:hypothetical protein